MKQNLVKITLLHPGKVPATTASAVTTSTTTNTEGGKTCTSTASTITGQFAFGDTSVKMSHTGASASSTTHMIPGSMNDEMCLKEGTSATTKTAKMTNSSAKRKTCRTSTSSNATTATVTATITTTTAHLTSVATMGKTSRTTNQLATCADEKQCLKAATTTPTQTTSAPIVIPIFSGKNL